MYGVAALFDNTMLRRRTQVDYPFGDVAKLSILLPGTMPAT